MQSSRRGVRDPYLTSGHHQMKDLSEAWNQLGKARKELRRMEHRLGDPLPLGADGGTAVGAGVVAGVGVGGAYGSSGGAAVSGLGQPLSGTTREHTYLVNSGSPPTARFVDAGRSPSAAGKGSSSSGHHHGARRKVSRLDNKDTGSRSHSSTTGRQRSRRSDHNVRSGGDNARPGQAWPRATTATAGKPVTTLHQRSASPKRVDFSQRLRLREVRWDGTYHDSVAHNTHPASSYPAPISPSSSVDECTRDGLTDTLDTITDSQALRETEIRFLNDTYLTDALTAPDARTDHHHRQRAPRLTHVDVDLPGSRVKDTKRGCDGEVKDTRTRSEGHGRPVSPGGGDHGMSRLERGAGGDMGDSSGGDSEKGAVGGVDCAARPRNSRMHKIKRSLKDLPHDDNILSQLREKIRQQRLSASSTDTSQNDSLASSLPISEASRDSSLQHMLHDGHDAVRVTGDAGTEKLPRSRKVAAGPPVPSYKGFSEAQMDSNLQATVKKVNRLTEPKKKSGGRGTHKSPDPVHNAIQTQLKAHGHYGFNLAPTSSVQPSSTSTPNCKGPDKVRKVARVTSQGSKPSKSGAKNLITTSSWRVGQELVARELGLPKARGRDDHGRGAGGSHEDQRRPDGAEGNGVNSGRVAATGSDSLGRPAATGKDGATQLAQSRALSDDAKKLFSDLQLDKDSRAPPRPAVKRKAPKAERETEKPEPMEKQRHYDHESVRQYMAKQKAERHKQKEEARKAEEQERQKRQQLMQDLISRQKTVASSTKPKKVKRAGRGKQRVLFPSDEQNAQSLDARIRALLGGESDKENADGHEMEVDRDDDDNSDADTLTGESEGSTPRATPVNPREDASRNPAHFDYNDENNFRPHNDHRLATGATTTAAAGGDGGALPTSQGAAPSGSSIEFHGKKLNLDVNTVLARFSQVLNQRQGHGREGGAVLGSERSRQERLQSLKATSKNLQNKISTASADIGHQQEADHDPVSASSSEAEMVPRYQRITGSQDHLSVFTSNLPGVHNVAVRNTTSEKTPAAGVRTSSQRESISTAVPRPAPLTLAAFNQHLDDDDSVTETSTFSEVTAAADEWEAETHKGRHKEGPAKATEETVSNNAVYAAPTASFQRWENPRADPYSVLNVFSRQQRYGVRAPNTDRSMDSFSQADSGRLRDPSILRSQQVTMGRTPEGHPVMTTTTYTRMEASLPDDAQVSQRSASVRNRVSRSEDRSERAHQPSYASRVRSMSEDTQSLDSEDEDTPKPASSRHSAKKSAVSLKRQMSDTGQETDVSQLSEDEPRISLRTYDRPIVDVSQQEPGQERMSADALERQMAAELARLESLEDSLRQLSSAERTRAVALAQQETVSVAQVLKARQQAHSAELRSLQLQVQEERLASAQQLQQQLIHSKGVQAPASDMSSLVVPLQQARPSGDRQLLDNAENRRPEAKVTTTGVTRSRGRDDTEYTETFTSVRDSRTAVTRSPSHSTVTRTPSSRSRSSASPRTAEDSSTSVKTAADSTTSVKTAEDSVRTADDSIRTAEDSTESIKTAEDSQADSDSSIKTASDSDRPRADASASAKQVADGDYSYSFEDSMTEDESFQQYRTADSHRRDAKRRKSSKAPISEDRSSLRPTDLTSVFGGEDSFNRFTIDIVRNIMREEEMRAQHQETLLRIRAKAVKEKTKTQLSLLKQEKQRLLEKGEGGAEAELKRLAEKEKAILKEQDQHQAEIDRMFKSEELAREHRQSLLKQHEQIAKMQQETREKMNQLQGRLGRPAEVHTEDEASLMEDLSDASDTSYAKDAKSDSETMQRKVKAKGDKQKMEKQQKLRLDHKYLTVREQKLLERKKQASELLRWKQDLDAEEEKVLQLERTALQAWEGRVSDKPPTRGAAAVGGGGEKKDRDARREETEKKVRAAGNLRQEAVARSEAATTPRTPRTARTDTATTPRSAVDSYTPFSQSEAVSTHISASETEQKRSGGTESTSRSRTIRTRSSHDSESSIAEDIPDGSYTHKEASPSPDKRMDSSDDTIINSSVNEEDETEVRSKGKKSPVGRLLPPGNSPLPQPWSRKTGSESESEESVSHTETQSDVSDYEARIRQLSDMLRRRRKEADMLKKERSKRMKEKLRAQEESLKKQLEAYENYIAQVKSEQADLEQEGGKPTVPPKIKQPGSAKSRTSPSSSPSPSRRSVQDDVSYSSSFDANDSSLTSPALSEKKDSKASPAVDKGKKKSTSTIMDRISEGSETLSDRSHKDKDKGQPSKPNATGSVSEASSLSEAIEEAVDSASATSETSQSAMLNIKTAEPAKVDSENRSASVGDDNLSYSQDFSEVASQSAAISHGKPVSVHSQPSQHAPKSEVLEAIESVIESAVSAAGSDSSAAPKFDLKGAPASEKEKDISAASASSRPVTGIQESDSESESRLNSHHTPSRPSSERSTGSTTYSDLHDFDQEEEEEDIISSESERTPVKASQSGKDKSSTAHSVRTDEDISEHISVSLPSISEKKSVSRATALGHQNSIDADLADLLGDEDPTPTQTPRAETPPLDQEETQDPLLMTDPLADFHDGDPVLVWGRLAGTLRFKGVVDFAPGFWAGVELKSAQGDTDGQRDGRRYFTCQPDHGVLVPGSDISAREEDEVGEVGVERLGEGMKSPDESITEHDASSTSDGQSLSPRQAPLSHHDQEEEEAGEPSRGTSRHDLALLADDITADLTRSLMEDSMLAINAIATRQKSPPSVTPRSPEDKTPPPTLPKPQVEGEKSPTSEKSASLTTAKPKDKVPPATLPKPQMSPEKSPPPTQPKPQTSPEKTPPPTLPKPQLSPEKTPPPTLPKPQLSPEKTPPPTLPKPQLSPEKTPPPTLPKPKLGPEQQEQLEKEKEASTERQNKKVDSTTSSVVDGLLNDAITKMMQIRRGRQESADSTEPALVNGFSDNDSGVDRSHDSSLEPGLGVSPEPEIGSGDKEEVKRPMSPEPFTRPKSPVPVNSPSQEEEDDEYDFSGLMGDSQDFFEEDFGLSAKPPPPYPGAGDQSSREGADSPMPGAKPASSADLFVVPRERSEVEAIVGEALAVFWNLRRCGEPWESASPPPEYLANIAPPGGTSEQMEGMVSASRRTFKQLVFDLTGDIVQEIYQHENETEPPAWHRTSPKRQRYYKGHSPPATLDVLLPVVQAAVTDILGLPGSTSRYRGKPVNKWNVRKKKDHVDAVLVEELQEEESDWINYDNDELAVKMQLTDTIFESLLADTVSTLNKVFSKRQLRLQTS